MIKVSEAQDIVLRAVNKTLPAETVNLLDSINRGIAEDIISKIDIPPFNNSAMDGYAVKSSDTPGELEVIEEVPAGHTAKQRISKGEAMRIMTGAPLPDGSDSVVMQEDTTRDLGFSKRVRVLKKILPGENIRMAGEDIGKGEKIIKKGTILRPAHVGVLASLGISKVKVRKRPKVGILITGDEIVGVNERLRPGKIHNSNGYSLYGQALLSGAEPVNLGIARDKKEEIRRKILKGIKNDILIISGGVSVGDYDYVHTVLEELGMKRKIQKVAMKPGKPVVFGLLKGKPVFGLPGNPVASMVSFGLFVKPAILKMIGSCEYYPKYVDAALEEDIKKKKGLKFFIRAVTEWKGGGYSTRTTGPQGSGILKSMTIANSLIELPENLDLAKKGDKVMVRFL